MVYGATTINDRLPSLYSMSDLGSVGLTELRTKKVTGTVRHTHLVRGGVYVYHNL